MTSFNPWIETLLRIPHVPNYGRMDGADCWGVVEIWYREVLKIELDDRSDIAPGPEGLAAGFAAKSNWQEIKTPVDDCLVIMSQGRIKAGHVGVFIGGKVLHSTPDTGCVLEPLNSLRIAPRTTCFLEYCPGIST